jgi:hypothetical protein
VPQPQDRIVFILIGSHDSDTQMAKEMLDAAGVRYRFAYGDPMGGPWPQLISGLVSFVGLEQISQVASRAERGGALASRQR